MKVELKVENLGSQLCVWIRGKNEQDINERFYSFWNHGATSGELHWELDLTAYFWTTPAKLLKALTNAHLFRLLNEGEADELDSGFNCFKGCKGGAMPYAKAHAQEEYNTLINEKGETGERNQWRYHGDRGYAEILEMSAESLDEPNKQTDWNTSHTNIFHKLGFKR